MWVGTRSPCYKSQGYFLFLSAFAYSVSYIAFVISLKIQIVLTDKIEYPWNLWHYDCTHVGERSMFIKMERNALMEIIIETIILCLTNVLSVI
jgi:hypothetical protein